MRKIFPLLLFLVGITCNVFGQWLQITSPSPNNLYSIYFIDTNTGFLSGNTSGVIIKTTNGGTSWSFISSETNSTFYNILFLDMNTGFAVGSTGTIVKTTNAGKTWSTRLTGSSNLNSISFPTASTGYAVGDSQVSFYKSTDGGDNWINVVPPSISALKDVFFYTNTNGWVCGYSGTIMETTDGGISWIPQFQSTSYNFERIYFNNLLTGYVIGSGGVIMKTENGGINWILSTSNVTTNLYGLTFGDENNGWASGSSGNIIHTTDGGNTWYQQTNPGASATYNAISMTSLLQGYIVGSNGILLKTSNGGGQPVLPIFQKITFGSIVTNIASTSGCAWGDYDNDGYQDLIVMPWNDHCWKCYYPIQLWHNNGDGTFTFVNNNITQLVVNALAASWGDYDNDGKLDIVITRPFNQTNFLFHNEGNGNFSLVTDNPIVNDTGMSGPCLWCDYDRDGWLDLFIGHGGGKPNSLFHNNGDGTFTKVTTGPIVTDIGATRGAAWCDYDNDGWPDLVVLNFNNLPPYLYHNNDNGTYTRVTNNVIANTPMYATGCCWGDYDNDGWQDLFVTCNNQPSKLFHNERHGNFTLINLPPVNEISGFGANWGDYDNDGWLDLFIPKHNSVNALYKNNKGTYFTKMTNEVVGNEGGVSEGAIWADYNNNGKLDLFVTNAYGSTPNYLYKNIGDIGNYLICKLHGCMPIPGYSNTTGIGAKIKIRKNDYMSIREVISGNGNMLWQHFGLGTFTDLDSVICYWPSGKIQIMTNVAANQTILIDECLAGNIKH